MAGAIELEAARRAVLAPVRPLPAETVGLDEALGRRLAEDAVAAAPVQGFDNAAMDGYAVRAADTAGASPASPAALPVVGESRAGHPSSRSLAPGAAIAISTGAVLPAGADAVVRVEDSRRNGDRVLLEAEATPGTSVRRAGEDVASGDTVLAAGALLGAAELAVLAAIDADPVRCRRRPRVAILTGGDELTPPGRPLAPGGIRDSSARALPALARLAGAEVVAVDWVPDAAAETAAALGRMLAATDVTIACGGVSVGEHDLVRAALARLGVEQVFWRVALKPGGPTWFGSHGEKLVFGLPGNPVSAIVTFLLLASPALIALAGGDPTERRTRARLGADCATPPDRLHAARCRLELDERGWVAWPASRQGSHVLTSLLGADCLALLPPSPDGVRAGETVEVQLLDRASIGA